MRLHLGQRRGGTSRSATREERRRLLSFIPDLILCSRPSFRRARPSHYHSAAEQPNAGVESETIGH